MQIAKFVVLGALDRLGDASGYDIFQYLRITQVEKWTSIQKPSIYSSLRQLEKEAAVSKIDILKTGNYPSKTVFRITEKGLAMFDSLQEEAFLGVYPEFYGFKIALKFNTRKTYAEICIYAGKAIAAIDAQLEAMNHYLKQMSAESGEYIRDSFFIEHDRRMYIIEREWILEALDFIKNNESLFF